jgi:hypothetical protein
MWHIRNEPGKYYTQPPRGRALPSDHKQLLYAARGSQKVAKAKLSLPFCMWRDA